MEKLDKKTKGFIHIPLLIVILLLVLGIFIVLNVISYNKYKERTLSANPNSGLNSSPKPSSSAAPNPPTITVSSATKQIGPSPAPINCTSKNNYDFRAETYPQFWTDLIYPQESVAQPFSISGDIASTILPKQNFANNVSADFNQLVQGDFDTSATMSVTVANNGLNNSGDQLVFHNSNWSNQYIVGLRKSDGGLNAFAGVSAPPNGWNELGNVPVSPSKVTVKMSKTGKDVTFFYGPSPDSLKQFANFTDNIGLNQGHIAIQVFSDGPDFPSVTGSFDHFTLNCH